MYKIFLILLIFGLQWAPARADDAQIMTNYLSSLIADEKNDYESVIKYARDSLKKSSQLTDEQKKDQREKLFNALLKTGRHVEALELANDIISDKSPLAGQAQLLKVADLLKNGKWTNDDGAPILQREGIFGAILGGFIRSYGALKNGQTSKALTSLREINASSRGSFEQVTLMHEAYIYIVTNRPKEAVELLTKNQTAESLAEPLQRTYIRALVAQKQDKLAQEFIKNLGPNISMALTYDAQILQKNGQLPLLIANAEGGLADALGRFATNLLGKLDDYAIDLAQIGLYLNPNNDELKIIIATGHLGLKNYLLARKYIEQIDKKSDQYSNGQIALSEVFFAQELKIDAIATLETLYNQYKNSLEVQAVLANGYRSVERFRDGEIIYSQIIQKIAKPQPQHYIYYYARGICYERQNQWPNAERDFLKALELKPDDPNTLNYLAYSWVDRGENLEKALKMLENAMNQRDNDGYIIDSVGWAYYKLNKPQEAIKYLERAIELIPDDPVITDHIGDISLALGRKNQARLYWMRALDFNPEAKDRAKIEEKIKSLN